MESANSPSGAAMVQRLRKSASYSGHAVRWILYRMPAIWYNILWEPNRRKKEKLFSSVYLRLDDLRFTIEATVHCLYFHFYSFICLSFHSFPYPAPSVTAERSCSLFFGEPEIDALPMMWSSGRNRKGESPKDWWHCWHLPSSSLW